MATTWMNIEVLYIKACPGYRGTLAMIDEIVLDNQINATVTATEVVNPNTPGFRGSPTLRINGEDIEHGGATVTCGLACRTYDAGGKLQNTPSREILTAAIKRAKL
jgi:hypothetical protein